MMEFFTNLLDLLLEASPWLVFGLALGGMIKALIPTEFLNRHLNGNNIQSIGKAALLGAPLPLCSCGVIPVALGLRQAGASKSATTSFLVSTPETGIDSISVTYALLGPFMAVVRPIAALSSALVAGLLVILFDKEEDLSSSQTRPNQSQGNTLKTTACCDSQPETVKISCCSSESETLQTEPQSHDQNTQRHPHNNTSNDSNDTSNESTSNNAASCCSTTENESSATTSWVVKAWGGIHYAFTSLYDDIILWLVVGMIFAALANTFLPTDFLVQWGQGIPAMLIIMLAGIPMYICATASTPVAAGLMMAGVSPGVALVLMLTGPATNVSTLGVIYKEMGKKTMILYLLGVSLTALLAGVVVNAIVDAYHINITAQLAEHGQVFAPLQWAALLLLIVLSIRKYIPTFTNRSKHNAHAKTT